MMSQSGMESMATGVDTMATGLVTMTTDWDRDHSEWAELRFSTESGVDIGQNIYMYSNGK